MISESLVSHQSRVYSISSNVGTAKYFSARMISFSILSEVSRTSAELYWRYQKGKGRKGKELSSILYSTQLSLEFSMKSTQNLHRWVPLLSHYEFSSLTMSVFLISSFCRMRILIREALSFVPFSNLGWPRRRKIELNADLKRLSKREFCKFTIEEKYKHNFMKRKFHFTTRS